MRGDRSAYIMGGSVKGKLFKWGSCNDFTEMENNSLEHFMLCSKKLQNMYL